MGADYGEKICQAIDEIVTAKLQGLAYDITKLCTIVDDTYSYQGKYTVSDGTARYDAYTTDVSLKKGNQVQVTIPNGDYNLQKTIIGRIATTDTTPFNYTSPLDTMITITNNVFDSAKTVYGENAGLLANGPQKLLGPIYSLEGEKELAGYTRLGLSANFRSWLNGLDVVSGTYGIKVLLYTDIMETASGVSTNEVVYELTFSSADMIGNPYQFDDYFYQEKVFDISNVNNIKRLEVYFYQDSAFINGDGDLIPYQDSDNLLGVTNKPNNLFVDDVQLFMGYEIGYFTGETLILYTPDTLSYSYKREELKEINLRWIHKIDEKTYEIINENNFDSDIYEIRWFKYNPGYEIIDQYAGKDWELIQNGSFTYHLAPEVKNQTEQIKVVGLIKGGINDENVQDITPYFSNLLVFENEELVPDQTTLKASTALSIYCMDKSEGNYFLYNQNGKIINEGIGKGYTRYFKAMYQGAEIDDKIGTINWIKWYFPTDATMLLTDKSMYTAENGKVTDENYNYRGVNYIEVTRESKDGALPSVEQAYSIENIWTAQKSNNTVMCRISINGVEYEALEQLGFGKAGTNGTNVTFLIEFAGNVNALTAGDSDSVEVRARLYTEADGAAGGLPVGCEVKWEWYRESSGNYITLLPINSTNKSYCLLKCNTSSVPNDNYYILKATYNGLEAYLPIPIKKNCAFIEGAREIIYDHQGTPSYYNDVYTCWASGTDGYTEIKGNWELNYDETTDGSELQKGFIPTLQDAPNRQGYKVISAALFYSSGYNDKVCVSLPDYWSQPILIMQSRYDFAMLNEWDGTLTIDEEKATILSTMLGAGKKNSDNSYSGVLIGDISQGSGLDAAPAQTGVYGLHEGQISYSLKEDGTATFGKSGKGQIKIDGNSGSIKSGNYDTSGDGTLINLDSGIINIKNNHETKVYISPNLSGEDESAYLTINGRGNVPLIQVNENKYFLQSHSYVASNQGTFLDLNDGTFNIQGNAGVIELSGDNNKNLFKITDKEKQTLIEMNNSNYYLQSNGYSGQVIRTINGYSMYNNTKTSIENGSTITYITSTVGLKDGKVYNYNNNSFTEVIFYDTDINLGSYETENGTVPSKYQYKADEYKKWFISYLEPIFTDSTPSGLHIDLNKGSIIGYDLFLRGIQSNDSSRSFTFDSSANEFPILVGDNLKISWDGSLWCNKLSRMVNDNRDYIISVCKNFYVDQNGSAGGSGASWTNSSLGGSFSGAAKCSSLSLGDNVLSCKNSKSFLTSASLSLNSYGIGGDVGDGIAVATGLQYGIVYGIDPKNTTTVSGSCSIQILGKTYTGTCSITIPETKSYLVATGSKGGVISLTKQSSPINYVSWAKKTQQGE